MIGCVRRCNCPNKPVGSTGCRFKFYYPNGGYYSGYWRKNKKHGWGLQMTAERTSSDYADKRVAEGQLIYNGMWKHNKRHGFGSMIRKRGMDQQLIFAGDWLHGQKSGEGKQFYPDGCVYFGQWQENRRHGLGIQWYGNGAIYLGEWEAGFRHGLGVHFYSNGNRYEGHFARGYKNGEGIFYHMHIGQIQKGMWVNDVVKTSVMQDESQIRRSVAVTPYPIPPNKLKYPNQIMRELFQQYRPHGDKPHRRFNDMVSLEFIHGHRQFVPLEERFSTPTKLNLYPNSNFICTCDCQIGN